MRDSVERVRISLIQSQSFLKFLNGKIMLAGVLTNLTQSNVRSAEFVVEPRRFAAVRAAHQLAQQKTAPPSTLIDCPVIALARSEQRNNAACAISFAV